MHPLMTVIGSHTELLNFEYVINFTFQLYQLGCKVAYTDFVHVCVGIVCMAPIIQFYDV